MKHSVYISQPYNWHIHLSKKEFYNSHKIILKNFDLKGFINKKIYHYLWKNFEKSAAKESTIADKILVIFKKRNLTLEEKKTLRKNNDEFVKNINHFIEKNLPILFTITQFAFKIPNPLKTTSKIPDLGELAFLSQLYDITQIIKHIYPPGAKIIIFGESFVFYKTVGISKKEASKYFNLIKKWIKFFRWDSLILTDLKILDRQITGFDREYAKNLSYHKIGWKNNDVNVRRVIEQTMKTLYLSMNTRRFPINLLMDIYNKGVLTESLVKIRKKISEETFKAVFPYLAYHRTISTTNMADVLFRSSIKISFTQNPNKLSAFIIGNWNKLYPYHGVAVLERQGKIKIEYEIDLKRKNKVFRYIFPKQRNVFFYTIGYEYKDF